MEIIEATKVFGFELPTSLFQFSLLNFANADKILIYLLNITNPTI